jgi:uncharacterized protein (TIGR02466 family)
MREMAWAFGIPILKSTCPVGNGLNDQLEQLILQLEKQEPGVKQSNRGGWQSEKTLQTIQSDAVATLLSLIDAAVCDIMGEAIGSASPAKIERDWEIVAWANINRRMNFNSMHYHVGGFWSGVYYVKLPADLADDEGVIAFRTPNLSPMLASVIPAPPELSDAFRHSIEIKPVPGMLLIFPSWLEHAVLPHSVAGERISIGFDVVYPQ